MTSKKRVGNERAPLARKLQKACKKGAVHEAFYAAMQMVVQMEEEPTLEQVVSVFFTEYKPHLETAFDSASLRGRSELVKSTLCSCIVTQSTKKTCWFHGKHTLLKWCTKLSHDKRLAKACAATCSLHERLRTMLEHGEYDLEDMIHLLMQRLPSACFSEELASIQRTVSARNRGEALTHCRPKSKQGKRPTLVTKDDYNVTSCRPDDDSVPEQAGMHEDGNADESTNENESLSVVSILSIPTLDGTLTEPLSSINHSIESGEWVENFSLASSFSMLETSSTAAAGENADNWELLSS